MRVPGAHNALNATAAWPPASGSGCPAADCRGAGRLQRRPGAGSSPRASAGGVAGRRRLRAPPDRDRGRRCAPRASGGGDGRVIAVFQPHLYSRTRLFADEFGAALGPRRRGRRARRLRRPGGPRARACRGRWSPARVPLPAGRVAFEPAVVGGRRRVAGRARPGDIVLTIGAGDVTMLGPEVLASARRARDAARGAAAMTADAPGRAPREGRSGPPPRLPAAARLRVVVGRWSRAVAARRRPRTGRQGPLAPTSASPLLAGAAVAAVAGPARGAVRTVGSVQVSGASPRWAGRSATPRHPPGPPLRPGDARAWRSGCGRCRGSARLGRPRLAGHAHRDVVERGPASPCRSPAASGSSPTTASTWAVEARPPAGLPARRARGRARARTAPAAEQAWHGLPQALAAEVVQPGRRAPTASGSRCAAARGSCGGVRRTARSRPRCWRHCAGRRPRPRDDLRRQRSRAPSVSAP